MLGLTGFHLVADGLFGLRDDFRVAALVGYLLGGRLGKVMGLYHKFPGQLAVAKNADPVRGAIGQSLGLERGGIDRGAVLERVQLADVDHVIGLVPGGMAKTTLGNAPEQGHLAAFEAPVRHFGAGAGVLALAAARGGLAVAAARTAADALLAFAAGYADMYGGKVH